MRKIISLILTIVISMSLLSISPIYAAEVSELSTNTYYDAAQIFSEAKTSSDSYTMSSAQKQAYDSFGDNIFGEPSEVNGEIKLTPANVMENWTTSTTKTFAVNVDSAGDYSVNILAREYNTRGFSIKMSGYKINGEAYEEEYITNYKNNENTEGVSGQEKIGANGSINLGIHYAKFAELAVGAHTLTITCYSGSNGNASKFHGLNICQTSKYAEPYVTIDSTETSGGTLSYSLKVPDSVTENGYQYYIALKNPDKKLINVKTNKPSGEFDNVDGDNYVLTVYTWTKEMEPVGMDIKKGYAELDISTDKGVDISEDLIGLFYEDISSAADGGLYAEQIENRSFEQLTAPDPSSHDGKSPIEVTNTPGYAWTSQKGNVEYKDDENSALNENNTHYASVTGSSDGAAITNAAYSGIYVEKDKEYNFSVWAKKGSYTGDISVSVTKGETTYLSGNLSAEDSLREDGWVKYSAKLTANNTVNEAAYTLSLPTLDENTSVCLDMISMMPADAVEGVFRNDLAEAMKELNPAFLRFPGGCAVEGYDLSGRYRWKDTVGPIESRKQTWNRWAYKVPEYNETYGLGFYEYFILCEYLNCKALPILNVGMACQYNTSELIPLYEEDGTAYTEEFMTYVEDALDLIEFANGDTTTKWGKLRAEMGHPEPFNLTMIGIGNEQWEANGNQWYERYEAFEKLIHAEYPDMKLISSAGPDISSSKYIGAWSWIRENSKTNPSFTYAVDEHNYNTKEWFFENDNFYDGYNRNVPVYLGEYAAKTYTTESNEKYSNDMISALSEAAFMTGIERNSDIVKMTSYAPLFSRDGRNSNNNKYSNWGPDMIWFNDTTLYKTPNYYVQKLLANNMGSYTLEANLTCATDQKLYQIASFDTDTKDIIIKTVNPNETESTININIDNNFTLTGKADIQYISSDKETTTNNFTNENIKDETEAIDVSNSISYNLKPYSYTIFRIHTK